MRDEFISQYRHFWKIFERIVPDFDEAAWIRSGHGLTTPARLALHIIQSTKYYIKDTSDVLRETGRSFETACGKLSDQDLPTREEILTLSRSMEHKAGGWLTELAFDAPNTDFPWAGKTQIGVALFLIRHSQYHLGEMSALLNELKQGAADDHYVKALQAGK